MAEERHGDAGDGVVAELGLGVGWPRWCAPTPSFSFKDRVAAARLDLRAVVFVPATTEPARLAAVTTYGAQLVLVDGTYDEVNRLVGQIAEERRWAFVNFTLRLY